MSSCCGLSDREHESILLRDSDDTEEEYLKMFPQKKFCHVKKFLLVLLLLFGLIVGGLITYYFWSNSSDTETSSSNLAYLAVMNATIWTADRDNLWANALLINRDEIVAVGSNDAILSSIASLGIQLTDIEYIDGQNTFITPGFIDSHVHILSSSFGLNGVQFDNTTTTDMFVRAISNYAQTVADGVWIRDGIWDNTLWGGEYPTKEWIDGVTPLNPVYLARTDGHMAICNSLTLELANITKDTPEVEGGTIVRYSDGTPTGMLKDNAMMLVDNILPPRTQEEEDNALRAGFAYLLSRGVTSTHDMGTFPYNATLAAYERARKGGYLNVRIYAAYPLSDYEVLNDRIQTQGWGDEWLHFGILKAFMDGSLGSGTGYQYDPYYVNGSAGPPEDIGLLVTTQEQLANWTAAADLLGLQVATHAIGDRANTIVLDTFEQISQQHTSRDRRFRIEHAQQLITQDRPRFAQLEVIASMQPYHAIDDGRWAEDVLGPDRIHDLYVFNSLLNASATVAFGSDWSVAPADVLLGLYAAATRRTTDGANDDGGWCPEQIISVEDALWGYTASGSYAGFTDLPNNPHFGRGVGILKPGYLADFVVFNGNLLTEDPVLLPNLKVIRTVVGGKTQFQFQASSTD